MKVSDIVDGSVYHDGKVMYRRVTGSLSRTKYQFPDDPDVDAVSYDAVRMPASGKPPRKGALLPVIKDECSRSNLASWAKVQVEPDNLPPLIREAMEAEQPFEAPPAPGMR